MSLINRITWAGMDLIDDILDRLSEHHRWQVACFLEDHKLISACHVDLYFWAKFPGESLFEISSCFTRGGYSDCHEVLA